MDGKNVKREKLGYIFFIVAGICYIFHAILEERTVLAFLTGICFIASGVIGFKNYKYRH